MKLNVHEIETEAKSLAYEEATETLNALLRHGSVCDFEFHAPATVQLQYYRAGDDVFFSGTASGAALGHCARCLATYPFTVAADFALVLVPKRPLPVETELCGDDLDLSFYEGDEIDLSPLVLEQLVLALPTRALCREACRGLCPTCGIDLNSGTCACVQDEGDPRLAVLRTLKVAR
jgi:uncharacterized protein